VELWLEMKLPDSEARTQILSELLKNIPEELRQVDVARLIGATEGFTGADLKRLIEDGKGIYAYDKAQSAPLKPVSDYFMQAVDTVKENKQHYAAAEAQALLQPKAGFPGFMRSFVSSQAFKVDEDD
jgi:ATP-dependent 26S proteasome regulatory subunit